VAGLPTEAAERDRAFSRDVDCPVVQAARSGEVVLGQGSGCCSRPGPRAGAVVGVPIWLHGRILGSLGLWFPKDAWFGTPEREFFLTVGRECAQALERARLYDAGVRARRQLQEQRRFVETVMRQMPLGVAIIDAASRKVLMANAKLPRSSAAGRRARGTWRTFSR
jgi:GAF domain-containing protein